MGIKSILKHLIVSVFVFSAVFFTSVTLAKAQGDGGGGVGCPCGYDGAGTLCWECPSEGCASDAQCGGGEVCCQGACVGSDQCGNSSSSCAATVNCPSGWTPAFNQTPTHVRQCGTGEAQVCSVGTAQQITGCCGSGQYDENGDWFCANQQYATYPCCAPGTAESCTSTPQETHIVSSGPYNLEDNGLPDLTNKCPAGETYTGTWSMGYCYQGNLQGTPVSGGRKTWCYLDLTCQPSDLVSCSCQPTCSATAPSVPALLSPANGASVTTEIISLVWNDTTQDWG